MAREHHAFRPWGECGSADKWFANSSSVWDGAASQHSRWSGFDYAARTRKLIPLGGKSNNYPALLLLALGIPLLVLTFSRSAWLGLSLFIVVLILKSKYFKRKKLISLNFHKHNCSGLYFISPSRDCIFPEIGNQNISTEQISTVGRFWQDQQAIEMIQKSPIIGVGIGSFILELSKTAIAGAPIEPVHNLPLLVTAELGIAGIILIFSICALIPDRFSFRNRPRQSLPGPC